MSWFLFTSFHGFFFFIFNRSVQLGECFSFTILETDHCFIIWNVRSEFFFLVRCRSISTWYKYAWLDLRSNHTHTRIHSFSVQWRCLCILFSLQTINNPKKNINQKLRKKKAKHMRSKHTDDESSEMFAKGEKNTCKQNKQLKTGHELPFDIFMSETPLSQLNRWLVDWKFVSSLG